MSFREKSAWAMALVTALAGLWYLGQLAALSATIATTPVPLGLLLRYVIFIILASVGAQVALAVVAPADAEAPADERERRALARAGSAAGDVLAFGLLLSLGLFMAMQDGNLLFHMAFFSLIIAQVVEYLVQAWLLRRGA